MTKITLCIIALALPLISRGQLVQFEAHLTGSQETPPNASAAEGWGNGWLDLSTLTLTWHESFTGLSAPAAAAHFHAPGAPGVAAPVIIPFAGFPLATSGSYDTSIVLTPLQESEFFSGLVYANIHDRNFPGGEIRGQVMQTPVPEPSTYALVGTGLLGLIAIARRRRATQPTV